jgi:hypothetical protein
MRKYRNVTATSAMPMMAPTGKDVDGKGSSALLAPELGLGAD